MSVSSHGVEQQFYRALHYHQAGDLAEAEAGYRKILMEAPEHAEALHLQGVLAYQEGRHEAAVSGISRSLTIQPDNPAACNNLGNALKKLGRLAEAEAAYRRAIEQQPDLAYAHNNLGNTLCDLDRPAEAEAAYRRALELTPDYIEAYSNLGSALNELDRPVEAEAVCLQALALKPDCADAHNNLGNALREQRRLSEAAAAYRQALVCKPDYAVAWSNLARVLREFGCFTEAESACRQAIALKPDLVEAFYTLSVVLKDLGRPVEAESACCQAIELSPERPEGYHNLLLNMQYRADATDAALLAAALQFGARFDDLSVISHLNNPSPFRCLRLGFISGDFRHHAVAYFLEPLVLQLDRTDFELHAYVTQPVTDTVSERLQRCFVQFLPVNSMTDDELASRIRADGIDILIDLAGHTAGNRLLVMARKPAPVQVTWLGYPGTTGLASIDWRITDAVADPPGSEKQYTEHLAFIPPPFCVYRPCIRNLLLRYQSLYQVRPSPALKNGFITFGSCNNIAKLTPDVLQTWSRLLERLPTARLLIEGKGFDTPVIAEYYREQWKAQGIPLDRLDLVAREEKNQYLTYHRIDIALDPFPLTGGTTSFDLLWMGVPLVSMCGDNFRSRMGMSILTAAGLTEWIARNEDEYIETALKLASDISALNARRLQQRTLIEASPLMDEPRFARLFDEALRQMWLKWCAQKVTPDNPDVQFQQWLQEWPKKPPEEPLVFLAPEKRIRLSEARQNLQQEFDKVWNPSLIHYPCKSGGETKVWQNLIWLARRILESVPKEPLALAVLAEAEYAHGNLQAGIRYLSYAVEAAPRNGQFYQKLTHWMTEADNPQKTANGGVDFDLSVGTDHVIRCCEEGRYSDAENFCRKIIAHHPNDAGIHNCLGFALAHSGRLKDATVSYRQAIALKPDFAEAHNNLGIALKNMGESDEAIRSYQDAIVLKPDFAEAYNNLGNLLKSLNRLDEAVVFFSRAIELRPDWADIWNNRGNVLKDLGCLVEGMDDLRHAIALKPDLVTAYSNLLLSLQYAPAAFVEEMMTVARSFAEQFETPLVSSWPVHNSPPLPWRRLRVGFLSPDYGSHAVMYFVEPLFALFDRNMFEVVCYYLAFPESGDHVTVRVRNRADHFVCLGGKQPNEQAAVIQADGIDILIDLAGHTARNGLLSMAHKPAPVQVTWLGYPGTTGLSAIDWRITDSVADKDVDELLADGLSEEHLIGVSPLNEQYSENLAFLPPPFCVYRPCIRNPLQRYWPQYQVHAAPAIASGYITFGSCNNLAKLTSNVLLTWGKLLRRLPTARLLIEGKGLQDEATVQLYRGKCAEYGIDTERLFFVPRDVCNQYLIYHHIDIALDPFPLTGGTTSFDVLWMGVPLVTMEGSSFRSRMGVSLLTAAGLTGWIAKDEEEYIEIAVKLASDIPALNSRRLQQRRMIEQSPLMDEIRFVRLFEEALRRMWLTWCAGKVSPYNLAAQVQQWLQERPQKIPVEPQVFLTPGKRVSLSEGRKLLQQALEIVDESGWQDVVQLATLVLESIPKEPMALAALAEAEYAHDHLQTAISYLSHAVDAMPQNAAFYHRLIHWHRQAGNEQAAQTLMRMMQQRGVQTDAAA